MCHIQPLEGMAWDRGKLDWGLMKYGVPDPNTAERWDEMRARMPSCEWANRHQHGQHQSYTPQAEMELRLNVPKSASVDIPSVPVLYNRVGPMPT